MKRSLPIRTVSSAAAAAGSGFTATEAGAETTDAAPAGPGVCACVCPGAGVADTAAEGVVAAVRGGFGGLGTSHSQARSTTSESPAAMRRRFSKGRSRLRAPDPSRRDGTGGSGRVAAGPARRRARGRIARSPRGRRASRSARSGRPGAEAAKEISCRSRGPRSRSSMATSPAHPPQGRSRHGRSVVLEKLGERGGGGRGPGVDDQARRADRELRPCAPENLAQASPHPVPRHRVADPARDRDPQARTRRSARGDPSRRKTWMWRPETRTPEA